MSKRKLMIDCDPGQDDAVAVLMAQARAETMDLLAITTVCGNNTAAMCTRNARILVTATRRPVCIAQGAVRPLLNEPMISEQFHGKTGMDGHHVEPDEMVVPDPRHAVEVLRDLLLASDDRVTIAALGPLTNLALLLRMWPEAAQKIEVISLMGGGLTHGNITD
ncbi:MAG: nucleoside hydrolase, partial [Oscillospiraceae bacterium]